MPEDGLWGERIAAELRDEIIRGVLKPGDRLKDGELAARFGVSRNTIRDGVKQLVTAGLVTSRLNAGNTVRRLTEADARDIYRVRRTLEITGVRDSAHAPEQRMHTVKVAVGEVTQAAQARQWSDVGTASLMLHHAFAGLNGSPQIDAFFANILAQLRLINAVMPDESEFQARWVTRDQKIADLVLSGRREDASDELVRYLEDSEARIIDAIRAVNAQYASTGS